MFRTSVATSCSEHVYTEQTPEQNIASTLAMEKLPNKSFWLRCIWRTYKTKHYKFSVIEHAAKQNNTNVLSSNKLSNKTQVAYNAPEHVPNKTCETCYPEEAHEQNITRPSDIRTSSRTSLRKSRFSALTTCLGFPNVSKSYESFLR